MQAANALAFLAKIDEVKEQAESVRHVRGLLDGRLIDRALLGLEQLWTRDVARICLARLAQGFDGRKTLPAPTAR